VDIGFIATDEEVEILNAFFSAQSVSDEELQELESEDIRQRGEARFQQQLRAFRKGLEQRRTQVNLRSWHGTRRPVRMRKEEFERRAAEMRA
jgi:hypothetical protein